MKSIPVDLTTELNKEAFTPAHLFSFAFATPEYFTDFSEPIWYGGNKYESWGMEFNSAQFSLDNSIDTVPIEMDNTDLTFTGIVLNNEIRNTEVTVLKVALNNNLQVIGAMTLFVGYIDTVDIEGDDTQRTAAFDLVNHLVRWTMQTPRRKHPSTCPWTFEDSDTCRYTFPGGRAETGTYSTGTATTTDGSKTVAFAGATLIGNVKKGDWFKINSDGINYIIAADPVDNNSLTLVTAFSGNYVGQAYTTSWDYTACDQSYDMCKYRFANTINFGGFRWLPWLMNQKIWWGRNPEA